MYSNKQILVTECNICNIHNRNRHLLVKKRIKTRRLTNIYHNDDDDVSDSSNLLSSLSLFLSPSSQDIYQQSVLRFFSTGWGLLLLLATVKSVFL